MEIDALIARGLQILIALGGAYFIALWFVLVVWAFRDIESRSRSVITQVLSTLLVVLFWIPGLALYWVLRPKETLDEAYQRSLEEEYLLQDLEELPLCPNCQHYVEDDFQLCPHCHTQLKDNCHNCDRLVDLRWAMCPYCGEQQHHHEDHDHEKVEVPDDRWIDPSAIEKRLREAEEQRIREETRALPAATASAESVRDLLGGPIRRMDRMRTVGVESIAHPAHHDTVATPASSNGTVPPTEAAEREIDDTEETRPTAAATARSPDRDDGSSDDSGEKGSEDGVSPPPNEQASPNNAKPGPTSVPKRFKVN